MFYDFNQYSIPRELVRSDCSKPKKKQVKEIRVSAYQEYEQVNQRISVEGKNNKIEVYQLRKYSTDVLGNKNYYKNVEMLVNNNGVFLIKTKPSKEKGSYIWLAAIPFAYMLDMVSYPIQVMMWKNYAGSH